MVRVDRRARGSVHQPSDRAPKDRSNTRPRADKHGTFSGSTSDGETAYLHDQLPPLARCVPAYRLALRPVSHLGITFPSRHRHRHTEPHRSPAGRWDDTAAGLRRISRFSFPAVAGALPDTRLRLTCAGGTLRSSSASGRWHHPFVREPQRCDVTAFQNHLHPDTGS